MTHTYYNFCKYNHFFEKMYRCLPLEGNTPIICFSGRDERNVEPRGKANLEADLNL